MVRKIDNYQLEILAKIEHRLINETKPPIIFLEGGHFSPKYGPTEFSINSLQEAIDLASNLISEFKKKIRVVLGILIDDLGLNCENICNPTIEKIKQGNGPLPAAIEIILSKSPIIKRDRVIISSERNAKNRGIETLKKIATESALIEVKEETGLRRIYFLADDGQRVLCAQSNGNNWVAKCATIMAQHYKDVSRKLDQRFPEKYRQIIVDFSEASDQIKVNRSSELAIRLFLEQDARKEIVNICFVDQACKKYIIDSFSQEDYED